MTPAPVITIDGPAASGKGAVAGALAEALGFHYLDSGKLYRAAALAALAVGENADEAAAVAAVTALAAAPDKLQALLTDEKISAPATGEKASQLAALPAVRAALVAAQHNARRPPGLVADGRDMGTVIFPDAAVKVFLTASLDERARRRALQIAEKNAETAGEKNTEKNLQKNENSDFSAIMADVREELRRRDLRDAGRKNAPLAKPPLAIVIDSTRLSVCSAVGILLTRVRIADVLSTP